MDPTPPTVGGAKGVAAHASILAACTCLIKKNTLHNLADLRTCAFCVIYGMKWHCGSCVSSVVSVRTQD